MKSPLFATVSVALLGCLGATACSPSAQRAAAYRNHMQKVVERLKPIGDPGKVAATDIAFSRAARDDGQWTAFARYAADGARLHGPDGVIAAQPWLATQSNPAEAVRWGPKSVWSSCDGTLAVSFGRFIEPDGTVGSYVTVWEWDAETRAYRWTYDMGAQDNPQPVRQPASLEPDEDTIVVQGLKGIEGRIADCPDQDATVTPRDATGTKDAYTSADGTLKWRFEHSDTSTRRVVVEWIREGSWQTALDFTAPPSLES